MAIDQGSDTVQSLTAEIVSAVREAIGPPGLLLTPKAARGFLGVSKAHFYRLASMDSLPPPVNAPGGGPKYRRADLERWVAELKVRKQRKPMELVA